ncbi:DNA-binding protein, partial [Thermus brockianus]|uniref:DNA-binding protein n=1 Tax=Thermus brockianus TaxID=56956 RepID=UPI001F3FE522
MPRTPSVTLADVKHALAELGLSPEEAGGQALRQHLGRGSLSTLQRYLELLRAEGARERSLSSAIEGTLRTLAPALKALAVQAAQGLYERSLAETLRALEEREALLEEQEGLFLRVLLDLDPRPPFRIFICVLTSRHRPQHPGDGQ